ncbi:hypothetical protein ACIQZG_09390 [Lysinibacillus sp. NPDC096418]|uniref:hypothetical protein n=1 Tax=Lysinibacillus sp. NPDC096418 TaxID=3364138 RepID=UPI003800FBC1
MKKIISGLVAILLVAGTYIFANKLYYPQSPIEHLSAKDILHKLRDSNEDIAMLSKEDNWTWYVTRSNNNGILEGDKKIKEMISKKGWAFKDKNGSVLSFEKNGRQLIVTTERWTGKYVLFKVPNND